jgi:hypothetical protein
VPYPRFDIGGIVHVFVVGNDVGVFDNDVDDGRVFEILTQAADCNAIATMTSDLNSNQSRAGRENEDY